MGMRCCVHFLSSIQNQNRVFLDCQPYPKINARLLAYLVLAVYDGATCSRVSDPWM